MKIFITGESGTIPLALQKIALENGHIVTNSQITNKYLKKFKTHQSFKIREPEIDFLDKAALSHYAIISSFKDADVIIHSGAFVGTDYCLANESLAIKTNIEGTKNIVDLCNKYNKPLIYFSTTAIFDPKDYSSSKNITENTNINPKTLYGITKYTGELIVKNLCKTKYLIIRPVFGYGNFPEDLHSALTKILYVSFKSCIKAQLYDDRIEIFNFKVLLNKDIQKTYTRVENIANCVLKLTNKFLNNELNNKEFNVGVSNLNAYNWYEMFEIIDKIFQEKYSLYNIKSFLNSIDFKSDEDYLHYHIIDNSLLKSVGCDIESDENYINLENGISLTLDSIYNNRNVKPYWI